MLFCCTPIKTLKPFTPAPMQSLIDEETRLTNHKEYLLLQLEMLNEEIHDLLTDTETATSANYNILGLQRMEIQREHMQVICDLARIEVQKEIVRCLTEKGLTDEAAFRVAKDSSDV